MGIDAFHAHLDKCSRCLNQPVNMCAEGNRLLLATSPGPDKQDADLLLDYQRDAIRSWGATSDLKFDLQILQLGLVGEAGEVADLIKKIKGHGHPPDRERLIKELGDVLWYVAVLHYALSLKERAPKPLHVEKRKPADPPTNSIQNAIGLCISAAELVQYIAGVGSDFGVILMFIKEMAEESESTLREVAQANINKLKLRYPDGFSSQASQRRADT
jgi:NTP pyrophosphatase (non-canonical NTP hydrolase)